MFSLNLGENSGHNETTKGRQIKDHQDEDNLMSTFMSVDKFTNMVPLVLQNVATRDLSTPKIKSDLLHASEKGLNYANHVMRERSRFVTHSPRYKPLTFTSLYEGNIVDL